MALFPIRFATKLGGAFPVTLPGAYTYVVNARRVFVALVIE